MEERHPPVERAIHFVRTDDRSGVRGMRRWFLSYNSQDLALMQPLDAALRRMDADAHIFFAPKSLRAGGYWLPELAKEIAEATAFVLLVGEKGLGPWQVIEYYEALDRRVKEQDFPVLLVLLDGQPAPGLPFLRQLHWIVTADPASEQSVAKLIDAADGGGSRPSALWRHTAPYRGLAAMTEADSDFFFGRGRETVAVLRALEAHPDKLPVLLGNSGVGKSSLAQAGIMAALARQAWPEEAADAGPWPAAFAYSRRWCFLTLRPGTEPVRALVEAFLDTWQFDAGDPARVKRRNEWVELLLDPNQNMTLSDLLDETERRDKELNRPKPPAFFLYVDQGEELYVRAEPRQRGRFSQLLAHGLGDPRLRALMSLRSDFLGALQGDEPLFDTRHQIDVPPLREAQLREVVSRPPALLSARFETERLAADIARRAAEESVKDAGALPLLSYLLDDMWVQMVERDDGTLRLPAAAIEFGGVLAQRADAFLASRPQSEEALRRLLTLRLATVREDGEPTRRRAPRSEFTEEEWRLATELANHPNRLLVTATTGAGETFAEVAHEAIFRRWERLREWIATERDFLVWRNALEAARRAWQATPDEAKDEALLMGLSLAQAQGWAAKRANDLPPTDRDFIDASVRRDTAERAQREGMRRRAWQMGALAAVLLLGIGSGLGWSNRAYLKARAVTLAEMVWPKVLTVEAERTLAPGRSFQECTHCPVMVVVPAGVFTMGSSKDEKGHKPTEEPAHEVSVQRFALSRFEVTFEEWDACFTLGGCTHRPSDQGWGRDLRPVINVSWNDAHQYVAWLSRRTGRTYRLLSEAEWEYAARAGSDRAYFWGDEIGAGNTACNRCGSQWDLKRTAPVGSFAANKFGLYDMHGNVWEWTQDCIHDNYRGAPKDGSAWIERGNCSGRVVRGGSWVSNPDLLRAAVRLGYTAGYRGYIVGFRVGRMIGP
jgi:formylglycine-generating enzyme required for sulfatase activity